MSSVATPVSTLNFSSCTRLRLQHTGVVVPTYNASAHWSQLQTSLERQGIAPEQVLIIDSSSSDHTRALAKRAGYLLRTIPQAQFRHGATRQMAFQQLPWAETLLYLTQDAIPSGKNSINHLLRAFDDSSVGAAYGRQLPRPQADAIEEHARLFNYPAESDVRDFSSRERLGFKAAFFSNSFAAYRCVALDDVGGFPDTIVSEEVTVAARMLMSGWKIAYQADATAVHSHPFTISQEFSRYFDIGVHHGRERWLLEAFGGAGGEGLKFIASEFRFLRKKKISAVPLAIFRNGSKWCAYKLGMRESHLPYWLKRALSAQPNFWQTEEDEQALPQDAQISGSTLRRDP
jgi:rhamnosyltransferase